MKTLKQIRCKNCRYSDERCEKDSTEQDCEPSFDDIREWLQQKQDNVNREPILTSGFLKKLLEELE